MHRDGAILKKRGNSYKEEVQGALQACRAYIRTYKIIVRQSKKSEYYNYQVLIFHKLYVKIVDNCGNYIVIDKDNQVVHTGTYDEPKTYEGNSYVKQ